MCPAFVIAPGLRLLRSAPAYRTLPLRTLQRGIRMRMVSSRTSPPVTSSISTPSSSSPTTALTSTSDASTLPARVILYDGVCGLCNTGVTALLRLDRRKIFHYAPLQSAVGIKLLREKGAPEDLSTIVYIEHGTNVYTHSDALLRIARALGPVLGIPAGIAQVLIPKSFRDLVYTYGLAKYRYEIFGKRNECRCGEPGYEDRFLK